MFVKKGQKDISAEIKCFYKIFRYFGILHKNYKNILSIMRTIYLQLLNNMIYTICKGVF